MSKEKPFEADIPGFYKKCSIDMALFGWVEGITHILPAVSQEKAIEIFMNHMKLSEDDYPIDSAKVTYQRIKNDFLWKTKS